MVLHKLEQTAGCEIDDECGRWTHPSKSLSCVLQSPMLVVVLAIRKWVLSIVGFCISAIDSRLLAYNMEELRRQHYVPYVIFNALFL